MSGLCAIHRRPAPSVTHAGLGFYKGLRFHIDARKYREWGTPGAQRRLSAARAVLAEGAMRRSPPPRLAAQPPRPLRQ